MAVMYPSKKASPSMTETMLGSFTPTTSLTTCTISDYSDYDFLKFKCYAFKPRSGTWGNTLPEAEMLVSVDYFKPWDVRSYIDPDYSYDYIGKEISMDVNSVVGSIGSRYVTSTTITISSISADSLNTTDLSVQAEADAPLVTVYGCKL